VAAAPLASLTPALPTTLPALLLPAHGVGSRQDLPLPFAAVVLGAAAALVVSFVALGALWHEPRLRRDSGIPLPRRAAAVLDSRVVRGSAVVLTLALTAWTLISLVLGRDDANNPVPYVVYVWLWVGLAAISLVLGPVWSVLNPIRWLHRGLTALARLDPDTALIDRSPGYWPAALGLFAFTWLELVAPDRTTLPVLRVAIGAYVLADLLGALVLGTRWFPRGDAFEVWSRLYGSLSPLGRRSDRRWVLRTPMHGANAIPVERGLLATVAVMLGGTAYDGFSSEPRWYTWVQSSSLPSGLLQSGGLLLMSVVVAALLQVAALASARLARVPARGLAGQFAPSLVPIAAGYLVAHYWSLWVYEGQNTLARLSDPLGTGADLLGTAHLTPDATLIQPTFVATLQVVAIVTGHVLGVVLAHERAVTLFDRRVAVLGQLPLLVLMVAYTCGGLYLLFSA
jgi:hypothetical protein